MHPITTKLKMDSRLIVIDFETTGLSAHGRDRVIEIGAVAIERGIVTDRYQSLVNPGTRISGFIEDYTGITNKMLDSAPRATKVVPELKKFISKSTLMAHNASFDRIFLDAEFARIGLKREQRFVCTMRMARRLYPGAPNHKLGTLVSYAKVPECGQFHRALADAEMTGLLWLQMSDLLRSRFRIQNIDLELMQLIESMPIKAADQRLRNL